jgi:hypothetical protein
VKTPDPQCPGPSALLVEAEETPPKIQGDPYRPEPAGEGNIQMVDLSLAKKYRHFHFRHEHVYSCQVF